MALHTKKDFAKMCGLTTGNLSVYEKRKKVIYSGDYIDDNIDLNKSFLESRKTKLEVSEPVEEKTLPAENVKKVKKGDAKPELSAPDVPKTAPNTRTTEFLRHENEKRSLQNERLKEEIDLIRMKKSKIGADTLPVGVIKAFIVIQAESAKVSWENATKEWLVRLTSKLQLSKDLQAEIYKGINETVNDTVVKAANLAKKSIRRVQLEISEKKGKGEHD